MGNSLEAANRGADDSRASEALVGNRYRLEVSLGTGGMGLVHLATDIRDGGHVAVKTLRPELVSNVLIRTRLQREAFVGARVHSRYVAQLLDYGEDPERGPFVVFEYLEGESLAEVMNRSESLTIAEAVEVAIDVLRGLEAFHKVGLMHRDVKPENIFLAREKGLRGTSRVGARLIDFGLSRAITPRRDGTERVTLEGFIAGTPEYMAPEQISDAPAQDERVDLYALGVLLYQMIAGQLPFVGTEPEKVFERVLHGRLRPLEEARLGIDPALAQIVHCSVSRAAPCRYETAKEMRLALADWQNRQPAESARVPHLDVSAPVALDADPLATSLSKQTPLRHPVAIVAASACVALMATVAIARIHRPATSPASTVLEARVTSTDGVRPRVQRPLPMHHEISHRETPRPAAPLIHTGPVAEAPAISVATAPPPRTPDRPRQRRPMSAAPTTTHVNALQPSVMESNEMLANPYTL